MTRSLRSYIPVVSLTIFGGIIFGQWQSAEAYSPGKTQSRSMLAEAKVDTPAEGGAKAASDKTNATAGNTVGSATQLDELKKEQALLRQMAEAIKRTHRPAIDMINECLRPLAPPAVGLAGDLDIREGDIIPDIPIQSEFAGKYA